MVAQTGQIGEMPGRGFTDKRRASAANAVKSSTVLATPANYQSLDTIEAALTAFSGTTYSQAQLNMMNLNDKLYALRLIQDSAGI